MKVLSPLAKLVLRHPVWSGLAFESLLAVLFCFFPVGPSNFSFVGIAVVYLHYPAVIFVERVLGIGFSARQALASAVLMAMVWIGALFLLRQVFRPTLRL